MILLASCDLGTAETSADHNLDTLHAEAHGASYGLLHCTAEGNTALELAGDILGNELSIGIDVLDLDDVYGNGRAEHCLKLSAELVDLGAVSSDDDTGLCAVDEHANVSAAVALDLDLRNACKVKLVIEVLAHLVIRNEGIAEFLVTCVPSRIPILDYADTQSVGINLLSHFSASSLNLFLSPQG